MKEALLIVNPRSGVDKGKDLLIETAVRLFEGHGLRLNVEFTDAPGDARRLARRGVEEGMETVVAAGGDGTVKDVADALWGTGTLMGIVPTGSGNGLARSLAVPQDYMEALAVILRGSSLVIDRGVAGGNSFYSAFGVGFDAEVSYRFSQDGRRGRTTYLKHALSRMFTYRPLRFRLSAGDTVINTEAMLVAVCNCMQYGNNAYISPKANPTDGQLDVTVVHGGNFFTKAIAGIDLFSGMLDKNVLVEMFRVPRIEIEGEGDFYMHLDGEPMPGETPISISCQGAGLKIAVPPGVHPFRPLLTPMKAVWEDILCDIRKNLRLQNEGHGRHNKKC